MRALGQAAEARWREAESVGLYQRALDHGDLQAGQYLAWLWQERQRADKARRVQEQAALAGDGEALKELLRLLLNRNTRSRPRSRPSRRPTKGIARLSSTWPALGAVIRTSCAPTQVI